MDRPACGESPTIAILKAYVPQLSFRKGTSTEKAGVKINRQCIKTYLPKNECWEKYFDLVKKKKAFGCKQ
jgi:hypothetical protein